MTDTADDADPVADFLFDFVAESLGAMLTDDPAKQDVAARAALRIVAGHAPADEAALLLTAQMVGFGIAALRALGTAARLGPDPIAAQRHHTIAVSLARQETRLRQSMRARQRGDRTAAARATPWPPRRSPSPAVAPVQPDSPAARPDAVSAHRMPVPADPRLRTDRPPVRASG